MKLLPRFLAALAAFQSAALAAPIPITGTMTYTQNFDSLGTTDAAWTDDSTVPGWYVQINNGATVPALLAADGSGDLNGLLNLGGTGAADRALGSKSTSGGANANIAYGVQFQNTTASPIKVSQIVYTGELWRTNNTAAGLAEQYTLFSASPATAITDIISGPNSATAAPGAGFTALGAAATWSSPTNLPAATMLNGNDPANKTTVTFAPPSLIVAPGQFLMIKWTDTNLGGTDGFQGIDDVSIQFTGLSANLVATVSNPTRNSNGTPANAADDTFGFTVTVTGAGNVGAGWTTTDANPPASNASSANYGTPAVWTGFPATGPKTINIRDNTFATATTSVTVDPPQIIGNNNASSPAGNVFLASGTPTQWVIDETAQTAIENNGGPAERVFTTLPVNLTSVSGFVRMSLDFQASETSAGSNFETDDTMLVELHLNDGVNPEQVILLTQPFDADVSGRMNGYTGVAAATPPPTALDDYNTNKARDEYNTQGQDGAASTDNTFSMGYDIPDSITSAYVVVRGDNDSASETFIIKNLKFEGALPALRATLGAVTPNNRGTADPSDDTYTAAITINAIQLGASTGWTSNGTPASGLYSAPNPVIFGPFSGPRTLTFTDNLNNTITASVALIPPPTAPLYIIGQKNFGAGAQDIQNLAGSTAPPEWVNDSVARTLTMTVGIATDSIVTSELIDLSSVGAVTFSANLNVAETSGGTNLEATDRFKAELIIDGVPRNLVTAYDKGNGASAVAGTGLNGAPDGYINGYSGAAGTDVATGTVYAAAADDYNANAARDEFNLGTGVPRVPQPVADSITNDYSLSFSIPASANSVQLKIYGAGFAGSETAVVSNVLFTSSTGGGADSDGDGVSDTDEGTMGTDPNNRSSVLRLSQSAADSKLITFPSVSGRFYRVFSSPDLQTWIGGGTTITGNGTTLSFTVTVVPGQPRRHYRLHVKGTDGPW